ncbi:MAG: 4Fe-4S cluster-binding domain-containing protein, partial [Candidatus Aminicenantes bacterium]|nr:4Fe-4S cluster-binding domain-containing protein [Candidatus Aminicenantes bacterium]
MKAKENKRITFEKENDQSFHMMVNKLFRLPWTMSDNAMTWLEPTRKCNITCDACFAINNPESQKTLSQIKKELETLLLLRRCDAMLIAGGEPLTHPQIVEITEMVKSYNVKPVIITN